MESEPQHALPQERKRANQKRGNQCDAGSKPIPSGSPPGIRPFRSGSLFQREIDHFLSVAITRTLEKDYEELRSKGIEFWTEPITFELKDGRQEGFVCCSDPDGTVIELIQV